MLRTLLLSCAVVVAAVCLPPGIIAAPPFEPVLIKGHPAHPTRILARRAEGWSASAQSAALSTSGLAVVRSSTLVPGLVVLDIEPAVASTQASGATVATLAASLPGDEALLARIEVLRASGLFAYVEPDYLVFAGAVPTDSAFTNGTLWGLRNTGQSGGAAGVDIGAEAAWDVTTGSSDVIVAVIDSGIRLTHVDLAAQLWRNPGEIAGNGRDDDNNGYIDDVHGINATSNDGNPVDENGHGTHVAGTIGAAANNGQPMVGVAWQVRLMACRFLGGETDGLTSDALECINYAVARGARILNCSWGGGGYSHSLFDTLAAARTAGVLVVAAAGNDGLSNDLAPHYPSGFDLDNIISVAAIDRSGGLAGFSNYGVRTVDLAAPGDSIYSTYSSSDTSYYTASGTSMAAPHVSGVAALVRAREPAISLADLRDRLLRTVVPSGSLASRVATGGRVHAHRALTMGSDGQLEISVLPATDVRLTGGRDLVVTVRVTDLIGVRGATVTATVSGGGTIVLRDDGVAPDLTADDADYTGTVAVPQGASQLVLGVTASAPGKASASETLTYVIEPPPPNDMFAARESLRGTSVSASGTNRGASREPGEPAHAGDAGGASVWWTWTATGDGTVTIDTEGSSFDTILGVYTGDSLGALTEVASNDDISGPNQPSRVAFAVTSGTTYQIAVDGFGGATGSIQVRVNARIVPDNDRFDRAIAITGSSVSVTGTTINSTLEPGEPSHATSPSSSVGGSVWWAWTSPADGAATITGTVGNWGGPMLAVYSGSSLGSLVRAAGRLDDNSSYSRARVTFGAHAGETYMIAVAHGSGISGVDYSLAVSLASSPANDHFSNGIALAGDAVTAQGNVSTASREIGEPGLPGPGTGTTLWWNWTPASSGTARLLTTGSVGRPTAGVFIGDTVSSLVEQTADLDGFGDPNYAKLEWRVTAGRVYRIVVDSYAAATDVQFSITVLPSPANDDFANRIQLTGTSIALSGDNNGATREPGEPLHASGRSANATLWWGWTAPADGTAVILGGPGLLAVYTGATVDGLTAVVGAVRPGFDGTRLITHVAAGTQYQIVRDSENFKTGQLPVSIEWHEAPANDMFAGRTSVTGTSVTLSGDTTYATLETGEPTHELSQHRGTLWWSWTAPINCTVILTSSIQQTLAVYSGDSVAALTSVMPPASMYPGQASAQFSAAAGQVYHLAVSPAGIDGAPGAVNLSCVVAPSNDHFAARTVLTGSSGSTTGTTSGATKESGEPYTGGVGRSVWWRWTAPAEGVASFSVGGSAFGAVIRVWEGDALSGLVSISEGRTASSWQSAAAARWVARAGVTYQISVDTFDGTAGAIALTYGLAPLPVNDAFARRALVSGTNFSVDVDCLGATAEPGEPGVVEGTSPRTTLWWRWIAPARGTLELRAPDFSQWIGVFSGSALASLVRLPDADGMSSLAVVHVDAGIEYQICVDNGGSEAARFTLAGALHAAPANDVFADRIVLTGVDASSAGSTLRGTAEVGEPNHGANQGMPSVWWTWTAPRSGLTAVTTRDVNFFHYIDVLTGPGVAQLTRTASGMANDMYGAGVTFNATAGTAYQIAVAESYYGGGPFTLRVLQPEIPANDMFANRATLTGSSGHIDGDNAGAGTEPMESHPDIGGSTSASVWWTWTAPSTGTATFTALGRDSVRKRIRAYTGSAPGALAVVPNAYGPDASNLRFHAEAGVAYAIAFFDVAYSYASGPFAIDYVLEPGPANDMFAAAEPIVGAAAHLEGTGTLATREPGEQPAVSWGTTASLWWSWTAPRGGVLQVRLDPHGRAGDLLLATGTQVSTLTTVDRANGSGSTPLSIRSKVTAGTTYRIRVDGTQGALGQYTLDLEFHDPPANDAFAARIALAGTDVSVSADNRGATAETGEPYFNQYYQPRATLWWSWTAPASGRTVITTDGSPIATMLGVYTGGSLGALTRIDGAIQFSGDSSAANVVFDAVKDTVYHIAVDGAWGAVGNIELRVAQTKPPANDLFADRIALAGEAVVASGSNFGATREAGEPQHAWSSTGRSVWWSWTAPRDGYLRIRTAGSSIDTLVAVYTGSVLNSLQMITYQARSELPVGERDVDLDIVVVAGTTYQIALQGIGTAMGDVTLSLDMYAIPQVQLAVGPTTIVAGRAGELSASVTGAAIQSYQWFKDGVAIPGATGPVISFASLQHFHSGTYTVRITTAHYTVTSEPMVVVVPAPPVSDARVLNLSTRALCQTGDSVLIPGFYIEGSGTKRLLMRAVGPELGRFGVGNFLPDPQIVLRRKSDNAIVASNDDWGDGPWEDIRDAARALYAFGLTEGSKSAALLIDLPAGGYSITASGHGDETGVAIVELYEVNGSTENARLINISNRGFVGVGGNVMIPGFVVSEEGSRTFLLRVVGPSLTRFGVDGVLADPLLQVYKRRAGTAIDDLILTNDNWGENDDADTARQTAVSVYAFGLTEGGKDAAFVVTLPPGVYTVQATGKGDTTGVALVEVYLVP